MAASMQARCFSAKPLTERDQQLLLGREMQIDRAFRDIGAGGNVVDGRGCHPLLEEQKLRGIQDFLAADLRRLGSWPDVWLHSRRSRLRSDGNRFIHISATATVPKPPRTAAGIAPSSAAVRPLSN